MTTKETIDEIVARVEREKEIEKRGVIRHKWSLVRSLIRELMAYEGLELSEEVIDSDNMTEAIYYGIGNALEFSLAYMPDEERAAFWEMLQKAGWYDAGGLGLAGDIWPRKDII